MCRRRSAAAAIALQPAPTVASSSTTAIPASRSAPSRGRNCVACSSRSPTNCSSAQSVENSRCTTSRRSSRSRKFGGSRGHIKTQRHRRRTLIATNGGDHTVTLYDVGTGVRIGTPITIPDDHSELERTRHRRPVADGRRGSRRWDRGQPDLEPRSGALVEAGVRRGRTQSDASRVGATHRRPRAVPGHVPSVPDRRLTFVGTPHWRREDRG